MRYSNLIGKTKKEAPKDETSLNAQLLIRAGFVQKDMAGVYVFLPLGLLVIQKISQIIREEMNAIGGQEVLLAALQNPEVWQKTGRWNDEVIDVWFKTKLHNGTELGLGNTHEEAMAGLFSKYVQSYKDLPFYAYQFQTKFRNELRSKSGLMRTREFIMKDLYSFNRSHEELDEFYEQAKNAYTKIFNRIGIGDKTYLTFASGGAFSKFSHEFQTLCSAGEDTIYVDYDKNLGVNKEVYTDEVLNDLGLDKNKLVEEKSIEVGNIFKLGTKYSSALGLTFADKDGTEKPVVMGSYGIGPARSMATAVELSHDEKGIIWPESIAPFKVCLVGLNLGDEKVKNFAEEVYKLLTKSGKEVLFDDREDVSVGEKFSDADLIGIPYRAVISAKNGNTIELMNRKTKETQNVSAEKFVNFI